MLREDRVLKDSVVRRAEEPGRPPARGRSIRKRSKFEVRWQDWAVAVALGAIMLLLGALALVVWGGWSHQRDVARAMEPPPVAGPVAAPPASTAGSAAGASHRAAVERKATDPRPADSGTRH